ncbi:hypothetical protein BJF93_13220 [Xaviernesmea oryzae]|uniref:Transglycosylase SLT domain-containing protein n=1 Tax=Xaviernesmea oryzae TaxID=464029 RepID=A0A1Q9AQX0_9HYPH|nr:hypothetical protein [Xaviernesmea oryzae]OLP57810.1 hypothetical protein BJF93_13220 [Xaviernesmea oryzae]SEL36119.1 hypothetical protein SAMN04487976_107224 [Xaviernesmea oryzae]
MTSDLSRRQFFAVATASGLALCQSSTPVRAWQMSPSLDDRLVPAAARWLMTNFGPSIIERTRNSHYSPALVCAIACQESGYAWYTKSLRKRYTPSDILRLMVLDNNTPRRAFPRDTRAFIEDSRVGHLAQALIEASDASRTARGLKPTGQLYYGYGIFQYDLQHIRNDEQFWRATPDDRTADPSRTGLWGDLNACLDRLFQELDSKRQKYPSDLRQTIRAYNGSGKNAEAYADIVMRFSRIISESGAA